MINPRLSAVLLLFFASILASRWAAGQPCSHYGGTPVASTAVLPLDDLTFDITVVGDLLAIVDGSEIELLSLADPDHPTVVGTHQGYATIMALSPAGGDNLCVGELGNTYLLDVSSPASPYITGNVTGIFPTRLVYDTFVYGVDGSSLHVVDVVDPWNPSVVSSTAVAAGAQFVAVEGEVVAVAGTGDISIYTVFDPLFPVFQGTIALAPGSHATALDLADYRLYVVSSDSHMLIYNLSNPSSPTLLSTTSTGFAFQVGVLGTRAFVAGGELVMFDVTVPTDPVELDRDATFESARGGIAVTTDHAYVAEHTAIVGSSGHLETFRHGTRAAVLGSVDTPGTAYSPAVSGSFAFVADYTGGLQVVDAADPEDLQIVGSLAAPLDAPYFVRISGSYAYVDDVNGMQVVDISNPLVPVHVTGVPTMAAGLFAFTGASMVLPVGVDGVQIVDIMDPTSPTVLGAVDTPGRAQDAAVRGQLAYIADTEAGLQIVDISDETMPSIVGAVALAGETRKVEVDGANAYVTNDLGELLVFDLTNSTEPAELGSVDLPASSFNHALDGDLIYLATGSEGLCVVDATDKTQPELLGCLDTSGVAIDVFLTDDRVYVSDAFDGLKVLPKQCSYPTGLPPGGPSRVARLLPPRPNPFNPATIIPFSLDRSQWVRLSILDVRGRRVAVLAERVFPAGWNEVRWSGVDLSASRVASGVYFAVMETKDAVETRRMVLLK